MVQIKKGNIPNFPPCYCKAYKMDSDNNEETFTVEQKDWDEYITALRQYNTAWHKLHEKIKNK